jgi:hypothetical protein
MQITVIVIFLTLIISSPWIAGKWGNRGVLTWVIISAVFLIAVILVLK